MARLPRFVLLSMLLAAFVFTGTADAHQLELPRAAKANKSFAKLLCGPSEEPEVVCLASKPGPCGRVSEHRVRCTIDLTVESKEDGARVRCRYLMEWLVRGNSPALRPNLLGVKWCRQVRAPQAPLP